MCAAVLAAVLYAEGYYDIAFIKRYEDETYPPVQYPPHEDTSQTPPQQDIPQEDEQQKIEIPTAEEYLNNKNNKISSDIFNPESDIIVKLPIKFNSSYEFSTVYKPDVKVKKTGASASREFLYQTLESVLYSAELYMGYIISSDENGTIVYNSDGTVALPLFEGRFDALPYERTSQGKPIFVINGENYVIENGALEKAGDKNEIKYYFNYPKSFANGVQSYNATEHGYYEIGQNNIYSLGAKYPDSGWVMVRNIKTHKNKVIEDMDILVNTQTHKEFKLQGGLNLISYSNQRLLLQKNDKYGFYAIKGDWITDINTYTYATPYCEGLAVVGTKEGKGVIDINGNTVIPFEYAHITECCEGVFIAYSETTGWTAFAKISLEGSAEK